MANFIPKNDAQEKILRFLWQDYTEGRSGHGRITSEEYTGYRSLLEKENGLFLVDIGRGEYDTYLSYADIEQLVEHNGISDERRVKVDPSHFAGENNEMSLYDLRKRYITRESEDSEGNPLKTFSERRLELLSGPLREEGHATTKAEMEEKRGAEVEATERSQEGIVPVTGPFASEKEQILALIEADEMNGRLTHEEAEAYREKAEFGELILVDVGTGNFDTYLSKEDAEELANDPENEGRTYRVFNRSLLDDDAQATGEIKVTELEDLFVKKEAVGALLSPAIEESTPVQETPEKALQDKQEKETESKRAEEIPQPGLPPSLQARAAVQEPHERVTPTPQPASEETEEQTFEMPRESQGALREGLAAALSAGLLPSGPRNVRQSSTEEPEPSQNAVSTPSRSATIPSPSRPTGGTPQYGQSQTQPQEAQSPMRGGPQRYQPPAAPAHKSRKSGKKWAAAMAGGTGGLFGGTVGFTLLRHMSDKPELTAWVGHVIDPLMRWFS